MLSEMFIRSADVSPTHFGRFDDNRNVQNALVKRLHPTPRSVWAAVARFAGAKAMKLRLLQ